MGNIALMSALIGGVVLGSVGYVAEKDSDGRWIVTGTTTTARPAPITASQAVVFLSTGPLEVTSGPVPMYEIQGMEVRPLPGGDRNPEAIRRLRRAFTTERDEKRKAELMDRLIRAIEGDAR